jgi:hypothetical protein
VSGTFKKVLWRARNDSRASLRLRKPFETPEETVSGGCGSAGSGVWRQGAARRTAPAALCGPGLVRTKATGTCAFQVLAESMIVERLATIRSCYRSCRPATTPRLAPPTTSEEAITDPFRIRRVKARGAAVRRTACSSLATSEPATHMPGSWRRFYVARFCCRSEDQSPDSALH